MNRTRFTINDSDAPVNPNPFVFPRVLPRPATPTDMPQAPPMTPQESCAAKVLLSGFLGYGMGAAMGLFLSSFEAVGGPIPMAGDREMPKVPLKEQARFAWKATTQKAHSWGKNFIIVTAVFSGVECVVEKYRAQHDHVNTAVAACTTGAALAAGQGPAGMCFGCAGFMAFSAAIDYMTGGMDL